MWWDALHIMLIFMNRCVPSFIIFCEFFFFFNPQRNYFHGKSKKIRRHFTTCVNLFFNFSQKSNIFIIIFQVGFLIFHVSWVCWGVNFPVFSSLLLYMHYIIGIRFPWMPRAFSPTNPPLFKGLYDFLRLHNYR